MTEDNKNIDLTSDDTKKTNLSSENIEKITQASECETKKITPTSEVKKKLAQISENNKKEVNPSRVEGKKKKIKKVKRIIYWLSIIIALSALTFSASQMYHYYKAKREWKKISETPLASLEPYMLYLKPEEKEALENYITLYSTIWDSSKNEFTKDGTSDNFKKLEAIYDSLPDALKTHLKDKNTQISTLWGIKAEYESFFYKDEILANITPSKIQSFIDNHWGKLTSYLDDNKSDYFESIYDKFMSLSDDTDNISILIEIFNSVYDTTDKGFEVKPDLETEALSNWNTYRNKIKNNWMFVSNKLDPLIKNAENVLKKHDSHLIKYNDVKKAQEAQAIFTKFKDEYELMKNNLVELPDFSGKSREEVEAWGAANNIRINTSEVWTDSDDNKDKVVNQSPKSPYTKIIKNSVLNIEINKGDKKKEEERIKKEEETKKAEEEKRLKEEKNSKEATENKTKTIIDETKDKIKETLNSIRGGE